MVRIKLSEFNFDTIKFNLGNSNEYGKIMNINEPLLFQTPALVIESIVIETNLSGLEKWYIIVKLKNTKACENFSKKIKELEKCVKKTQRLQINELIQDDQTFKLKVPFKNGNTQIKIYDTNGRLFNYFHLNSGMEIKCLVDFSKIWINDIINYNLTISEILISKDI